LDLNKNVDKQTKLRYGLTDNENIFYCTKIKDELSVSPPA
jgi:hypothetical protein